MGPGSVCSCHLVFAGSVGFVVRKTVNDPLDASNSPDLAGMAVRLLVSQLFSFCLSCGRSFVHKSGVSHGHLQHYR